MDDISLLKRNITYLRERNEKLETDLHECNKRVSILLGFEKLITNVFKRQKVNDIVVIKEYNQLIGEYNKVFAVKKSTIPQNNCPKEKTIQHPIKPMNIGYKFLDYAESVVCPHCRKNIVLSDGKPMLCHQVFNRKNNCFELRFTEAKNQQNSDAKQCSPIPVSKPGVKNVVSTVQQNNSVPQKKILIVDTNSKSVKISSVDNRTDLMETPKQLKADTSCNPSSKVSSGSVKIISIRSLGKTNQTDKSVNVVELNSPLNKFKIISQKSLSEPKSSDDSTPVVQTSDRSPSPTTKATSLINELEHLNEKIPETDLNRGQSLDEPPVNVATQSQEKQMVWNPKTNSYFLRAKRVITQQNTAYSLIQTIETPEPITQTNDKSNNSVLNDNKNIGPKNMPKRVVRKNGLKRISGPDHQPYRNKYWDPMIRLYRCPFLNCEKAVEESQKLSYHIKTVHTPKKYICQFPNCGKRYHEFYFYRKHEMVHKNQYLFKCDDCDYKTNSKFGLKQHREVRHTIGKTFKCDANDCGQSFKTERSLKEHQNIHTNHYKFKCKINGCTEKFFLSRQLKIHYIKSHDKVYPCDWPGCDYKAPSPFAFKAHRRVHTGEKPFQCDWPECYKQFSRKEYLKSHEKVHLKPNK